MFKLTIIIPIYNVENYIEECIKSVLIQLNQDIQLIFVNDGTPDNSIHILNRILEQYTISVPGQFKIINQDNMGLSGARNTGIKLADGEYIGFLDSDDKLTPDYIEQLLYVINQKKYDIIDFNFITSEGVINKIRDKSFNSIFSIMKWYSWSRVYKKELFNKNKFTVGINYEDLDLTPTLYIKSNSSYHINKALYWYRTNDNGITRSFTLENNIKTVESLEFILNKYLNLFNENKNQYYAMVAMGCYYFLCISTCRRFNLIRTFSYIKKYKTLMRNIDVNKLPIEYSLIDKKILLFCKNPTLYCSAYIIYDRLRYLKNKF